METIKADPVYKKICEQFDYFLPMTRRILGYLGRPEDLAGNDRLQILVASQARSEQLVLAILLLSEGLFAEEIKCLNRTLAELVINAIYLQFAEDSEVQRFRHFDAASAKGNLDQLSRQMTPKERHQVALDRQESDFDKVIEDARSQIGASEEDRSWSKRSVHARAMATDRHFERPQLMPIFAMSYQLNHSSVHSTWLSLTGFVSWQERKQGLADRRRIEETIMHLQGTANTISTFGKFLAQKAKQSESDYGSP